MNVVPLRDGQDEIFAIMFVLIDVTPIKQAQFALIKVNEELETKVLERTNQLKQANHLLESFSYSVSHDLQAPLRSISGFTNILKEDYADRIKDNEFEKLTSRIIANVSKMKTLIDDLLQFSKIERKELSRSRIDMDKMVHEMMDELLTQQSSRTFDVSIGPLEPVEGDRTLIQQVWMNLLSNAIKYTKKKDLTSIEIGCSVDKDIVCYFVSDNGAGFDMKFADKLFGAFQRLHSPSEFEGTGVGLVVVKNILERHGGKIWVESERDKGTIFYFTLPVIN